MLIHCSLNNKHTNLLLGRDTRKRAPGEPVPKHVANKRQRVGLDDIPDTAKSVVFDSIPSHIKVDLFNNIVKTALPNFDNLMTAAWNVVYVHKNVGSEDRELYKSITCLEKVLQEFSSFHRKPKTKMEAPDKTAREQASSQNAHQRTSLGNRTANSSMGARNNEAQDRSQIHIVQMAGNDGETNNKETARNIPYVSGADAREGRYAPEYESPNEPASMSHSPEQQEEPLTNRLTLEKLQKQLSSGRLNSSNANSMQYLRENSPLYDGPTHYENERSQRTNEIIKREQQQRATNSQRDHLNSHDPRKYPYPTLPSSQKAKAARESHRQMYASGTDGTVDSWEEPRGTEEEAAAEANITEEPPRPRYGTVENTSDEEPDAEPAERPNLSAAPPPPAPAPGVFLGQSKLGAPKVPSNATGSAPVAPMMHIRKESGGERRIR
jgi:hypothetical protein